MREAYGKLDRVEMSIWECCELLNDVIDDSDPDLDEPQIEHLLQTAEAIRKDYPNEDWLHLTGLIHGIQYTYIHIYIYISTLFNFFVSQELIFPKYSIYAYLFVLEWVYRSWKGPASS